MLANEVYGVRLPEFLLGGGKDHLGVYESGYKRLEVRFDEVPGRFGLDAIGEESENVILAFFRQPGLTRDVKFNLVQVNLDDLRGKGVHKTISKGTILVLEGAGKLGWIAVTSVEATKGGICPLFGLPPLTAFSFLFIRWHCILGNLKIDNLEEKPPP